MNELSITLKYAKVLFFLSLFIKVLHFYYRFTNTKCTYTLLKRTLHHPLPRKFEVVHIVRDFSAEEFVHVDFG